MSDIYQSTDKLPDNPYPERSHLLTEGTIDFLTSDFVSVGSGNYLGSRSIRISDYIKLGDRLREYPPEMPEVKAWVNQTTQVSGVIGDRFNQLPYTGVIYSTIITPSSQQGTVSFYIYNGYDVIADTWESILVFNALVNFQPTSSQFNLCVNYKVYNTIYRFTNYIV